MLYKYIILLPSRLNSFYPTCYIVYVSCLAFAHLNVAVHMILHQSLKLKIAQDKIKKIIMGEVGGGRGASYKLS